MAVMSCASIVFIFNLLCFPRTVNIYRSVNQRQLNWPTLGKSNVSWFKMTGWRSLTKWNKIGLHRPESYCSHCHNSNVSNRCLTIVSYSPTSYESIVCKLIQSTSRDLQYYIDIRSEYKCANHDWRIAPQKYIT